MAPTSYNLHIFLVVGLCVSAASSVSARDIEGLKESEFHCLGDAVPRLATGLRCPGDPLDLAEFKRSLRVLSDTDAKPAPKQPATEPTVKPAHIAEKTETFKATVPVWPHSVSVGTAARGALYNGVTLEDSDRVKVRAKRNYGTREMVEAIRYAVDAVHEQYPDSPRLPIGDLSKKRGGPFPPHVSHQSGLDADIAYYQKGKHHHPRYLKYTTTKTLDVPRTWAFIEAMIADNKVEYLFTDYRLMALLYRYAKNVKKMSDEDLEKTFSYPRGRSARVGILRHLKGHADHMHVRFYAPQSVAAVKELVRRHGAKVLQPVPVYARVRSGDSLWKIARRHKTRIKKLLRWNRIGRRKVLKVGSKLIVGWKRPRLPGEPRG